MNWFCWFFPCLLGWFWCWFYHVCQKRSFRKRKGFSMATDVNWLLNDFLEEPVPRVFGSLTLWFCSPWRSDNFLGAYDVISQRQTNHLIWIRIKWAKYIWLRGRKKVWPNFELERILQMLRFVCVCIQINTNPARFEGSQNNYDARLSKFQITWFSDDLVSDCRRKFHCCISRSWYCH